MFLLWISSAACLDFGTSFLKLRSVWEDASSLFPRTKASIAYDNFTLSPLYIYNFLAFESDIIRSAFLIYKDTCAIYMYMWRHLWNIYLNHLVNNHSVQYSDLQSMSSRHGWLPGNLHIVGASSFFNFPWTSSFISCQKSYKFISCKKKHTLKSRLKRGIHIVSLKPSGKAIFYLKYKSFTF